MTGDDESAVMLDKKGYLGLCPNEVKGEEDVE